MGLVLHNTHTRRKEPLVPQREGQVRMYVCGPNLYGPCHVGHAMSYIVFDILRRYLEYRGYQVTHVQNFTDIEDRIIEAARAQNMSTQELARIYRDRFFREMDALNVLRAHHYPQATQFIPHMVQIIQKLLANGHAYQVDGDVYYRVTKFPRYGQLASRSLEEMKAGARVEVDPRKEHPLDFALWKAAKPGEPSWESPWGPGRPGWHIECTAMSLYYLGEQLDIHGGGQDLIFPHHENEIAQSEAYSGMAPFVKYWIHNGLLRPSPDQEKMTRHLSNFVSCQEALDRHQPDALRLWILSAHYRNPLTWSEQGLQAAEQGLERLRTALRPAPGQGESPRLQQEVARARESFIEAMDDDLNTAQATAALFELARAINQARDEGGGEIAPAQALLRELAGVLGLRLQEQQIVDEATRGEIEALIAQRNQLRAEKKWEEADRIRAQLSQRGVILEDGPDGTTWRLAPP